jgi:hypothetical protein
VTELPEPPETPAFRPVRRLAVDAHVHFHAPRHVAETLDAAFLNFSQVFSAAEGLGVLLLAQSAGERVFEWLRGESRIDSWSVTPVIAEPESLWLRGGRGEQLVVCGRQVIAEPGLEVLALGTDRAIDDGLGLEQTLKLARDSNALAVLPWGFGKWIGRRRRRIRAQLASSAPGELWLGDNGGRLRDLPRPGLLDEAETQGISVLPGTDPFRFGNDYRRVGSFGFMLDVAMDDTRPWRSMRTALSRLRGSPQPYGRAEGWLGFAFKQAWIQVDKRIGRRPA